MEQQRQNVFDALPVSVFERRCCSSWPGSRQNKRRPGSSCHRCHLLSTGHIEGNFGPALSPVSSRLSQPNLSATIVAKSEQGPFRRQGEHVQVTDCHVLNIFAVVYFDVVWNTAEGQEGCLARLCSIRRHAPEIDAAALRQRSEGVAPSRHMLDWLTEIGEVGYDAGFTCRPRWSSVCLL